jgi:hypothetical protein
LQDALGDGDDVIVGHADVQDELVAARRPAKPWCERMRATSERTRSPVTCPPRSLTRLKWSMSQIITAPPSLAGWPIATRPAMVTAWRIVRTRTGREAEAEFANRSRFAANSASFSSTAVSFARRGVGVAAQGQHALNRAIEHR